MQTKPRLLVNLLVILVTILVNLLVKLTRMKVRGAMGGAFPSYDASRECISPQARGCHGALALRPWRSQCTRPTGIEGNPPPGWPPLILGVYRLVVFVCRCFTGYFGLS